MLEIPDAPHHIRQTKDHECCEQGANLAIKHAVAGQSSAHGLFSLLAKPAEKKVYAEEKEEREGEEAPSVVGLPSLDQLQMLVLIHCDLLDVEIHEDCQEFERDQSQEQILAAHDPPVHPVALLAVELPFV